MPGQLLFIGLLFFQDFTIQSTSDQIAHRIKSLTDHLEEFNVAGLTEYLAKQGDSGRVWGWLAKARQPGGGRDRYPCIIMGINGRNPGDYLRDMRLRNKKVSIRWEIRGDMQMVEATDVTLQIRWGAEGFRVLHPWEHGA